MINAFWDLVAFPMIASMLSNALTTSSQELAAARVEGWVASVAEAACKGRWHAASHHPALCAPAQPTPSSQTGYVPPHCK